VGSTGPSLIGQLHHNGILPLSNASPLHEHGSTPFLFFEGTLRAAFFQSLTLIALASPLSFRWKHVSSRPAVKTFFSLSAQVSKRPSVVFFRPRRREQHFFFSSRPCHFFLSLDAAETEQFFPLPPRYLENGSSSPARTVTVNRAFFLCPAAVVSILFFSARPGLKPFPPALPISIPPFGRERWSKTLLTLDSLLPRVLCTAETTTCPSRFNRRSPSLFFSPPPGEKVLFPHLFPVSPRWRYLPFFS